jgi:hypothetical protein
MSGGVAVQELHCPTCGEPYELPLTAEYEDEPDFHWNLDKQTVRRPSRPYVTCPLGHKWTVAVVFRDQFTGWDEILLGDYIGGGV